MTHAAIESVRLSKSSEYAVLLSDPRWQRKRLEILGRDNWTCRKCEAKGVNLHVHHTYYDLRVSPWQYPDHTLITLCVDCHADEELLKSEMNRRLSQAFRRLGADNDAMARVSLLIEEMGTCSRHPAAALGLLEEHIDRAWSSSLLK